MKINKFQAIKSDYDIKKIYEQLELDLIASMRNNLANHKDEEDLEHFNWPQWQAIKLKQMQRFAEENRELINNCNKTVRNGVYSLIKEQFKEATLSANKEAIKAGFLKANDAKFGRFLFWNKR